MKKLALILAFLVIPCAAFGLEMLNDTSMDAITGQDGVHIAMDDVEMFINIDRLAYIDCDGYNWTTNTNMAQCSGAAGAIYIGQFQIDTLKVNAILSHTNSDDYNQGVGQATTQTILAGQGGSYSYELFSASCGLVPLQYNYGNTTRLYGCYLGSSAAANFETAGLDHLTGRMGTGQFVPNAITIDVTDRLPALSQALGATGGVLIGLPTVELSIGDMTMTPRYTGDISGVASAAWNNNDSFGTIVIENVTLTILSGWIEIAPHH